MQSLPSEGRRGTLGTNKSVQAREYGEMSPTEKARVDFSTPSLSTNWQSWPQKTSPTSSRNLRRGAHRQLGGLHPPPTPPTRKQAPGVPEDRHPPGRRPQGGLDGVARGPTAPPAGPSPPPRRPTRGSERPQDRSPERLSRTAVVHRHLPAEDKTAMQL
ncbi:serine/arginine repetitive matrix protein 1-like [Bubalus kerabau]|uniref:serine/arginine repetitive matrix protein 1-like n=1 Tax=Bubalus carabanensis TaxID=3119969 RepID=UPI00244EF387|nr:serine/arginine repetitive matrix protein 1-like [Bubalus carabanensis]